jgi:hypothetical protein
LLSRPISGGNRFLKTDDVALPAKEAVVN